MESARSRISKFSRTLDEAALKQRVSIPTPGLIQIDPVRSLHVGLVAVTVRNLHIGALHLVPLVTTVPLSAIDE